MRAVLIVAVAALLVGPGFAASTPDPQADSADKERLVCKTSNQIGSRLRKTKSCRTAKEWADLTDQTQEKTREIQRVGWKPPGG